MLLVVLQKMMITSSVEDLYGPLKEDFILFQPSLSLGHAIKHGYALLAQRNHHDFDFENV